MEEMALDGVEFFDVAAARRWSQRASQLAKRLVTRGAMPQK
jgi:hypothetical protein